MTKRRKYLFTIEGSKVYADEMHDHDEFITRLPPVPFTGDVLEAFGTGAARHRLVTREELAREFPTPPGKPSPE